MVHHLNRKLFAKGFPSDMGAMVHHLNRKLFAKSFLSDMGLWCIISTGNDWRTVSCPACEQCVSTQQETVSERFPVRHVSSVHHRNRKLLAKGFPSDMGLWCIISTGNCQRKVSCPACEQCASSQQETISEKFPVRHGAMFTISIGNY